MEQKTLEVLDGDAWVTARHSTDAMFRRVLPWWWNGSLPLLFFAAHLRAGTGRWDGVGGRAAAAGGDRGDAGDRGADE